LRLGFIGLGNMGAALAAGILNSGAIAAEDVVLANRTPSKAEAFSSRFPGTRVVHCNRDAVADVVFVSVKADQMAGVLKEICPSPGSHIVVVNGGMSLAKLEGACGGPVSKLIPSVTMELGRGVSLLCHGGTVGSEQASHLERLLGACSKVHMVTEAQLDVATDLTSCGPALIAEIANQLALAGVRHGGIGPEEARQMVLETLMGAAMFLNDGRTTIEGLRSMVATKGGITEEGLKVLEERMPAVFDEVMERTASKQAAMRKRLADPQPL